MRLALTAFTARGAALAQALAEKLTGLGNRCMIAVPARLNLAVPTYENLGAWTGERFADCEGILFIGASGIAVRAIAPYVRDKFTDPAVVSVDETGQFAVPLLSGHVGGANDLARTVAAMTGGRAAVSTATDVNGKFAVDQWAREQGFFLDGKEAAKCISAALLSGKPVGLKSDFPIQGELPDGVMEGAAELGFAITLDDAAAPFPMTLRLIPRVLNLGIGCRRGVTAEAIAGAVGEVLCAHRLSSKAVRQVCTIDLKKEEAGLLAFCRQWGLPLRTFTPQELAEISGEFTPSEFVRGVTGVDNVCERAAVRAGGELVVRKQAGGGVTVAVSREPLVISLEGESA